MGTDAADPVWVRVDCDAAGEPRGVHLAGGRRGVVQVLDRWDDDGRATDGEISRILKVLLDGGETVFLEQDIGTKAWTLRGAAGRKA